MREEFHFRGSGGQGILLMGLVLAYSALEEGLHVSWIPSYGAERRGGTSFCAVTVSDEPVDCPVTDQPTLLFTMDQRAARAYASSLRPDAVLVYNSSLVSELPAGSFRAYGVEASKLAAEAKLAPAANMVALGARPGGQARGETDLGGPGLAQGFGRAQEPSGSGQFQRAGDRLQVCPPRFPRRTLIPIYPPREKYF